MPRPFFGTRPDSTLLQYSPGISFSSTRPNSTFLRYWPEFYHYPILAWILPSPVLTRTPFRYLLGFYQSLVFARFYHSPVLDRILPFSGTRLDTTFPGTRSNLFLVLARILPFSSTHMDSTLLWYWPEFNHSPVLTWILPLPVLAGTFFQYSPGFYPSPIPAQILPFSGTCLDTTFLGTRSDLFLLLARILPFSGTSQNSTILWYSPGYYLSRYSPEPFYDTRMDSTILRYSPRFYLCQFSPGLYPSPVLVWILPFPVLAWTPFRYLSIFYDSRVLS